MNKYIRKIFNKIFTHRKIVESFICQGTDLNIIDTIYPIGKYNIRCIEDDIGGWYSAVYTDKNMILQPILINVQKIISLWSIILKEPLNALVLGCAGCSLVRFISFQYPKCNIIGIESSDKLIEVAKKYFFLEQYHHFKIIHDDAFRFVNNEEKQSYDIIIVDLYLKNEICQQVFGEEFITNLYRICNTNALVVINMFGVQTHMIKPVAYNKFVKFIVSDRNNSPYLLLIKSNEQNLIDKFSHSLKQHYCII